MVSVDRYHQISECSDRIINPLSLEKLLLVADICHIDRSMQVLDLASGEGELLCQLAAKFGASGIGIDIYPPVVATPRLEQKSLGLRTSSTSSKAMLQQGGIGVSPSMS